MKEGSSFLKKRSKKLLLMGSSGRAERAGLVLPEADKRERFATEGAANGIFAQ
jgi:hypothetical protein